ncbi:uncharacterized protein DS421_2g37950 [Arachis hypogaea]|nr:uncharacterized protein DS421_2g37950 [Arachis hypogaea]
MGKRRSWLVVQKSIGEAVWRIEWLLAVETMEGGCACDRKERRERELAGD